MFTFIATVSRASGGAGGNPGAAGNAGVSSTYGGGGAGAAGKGINLNGNAVTWVSGNDGTHVKGAVS